ncbi:MAG: hypothetical protein F4187_07890 [Gemmatimonadetes bacterium]|nr:hypothetical protein [Gemmatimonadota bacterium]MYI07672.1 hypothetical protein [Gemmatimonadota bacterium]
MIRVIFSGVAVLVAAAPAIAAQQVVEIDFEAGRIIIDDEWRSMYFGLAVVDWNRNVLYVDDMEAPDGIMAFSLQTGEWLRTIPTLLGDGPGEFPQGRSGIALTAAGGLYISGLRRVVEFDSLGVAVSNWSPPTPPTRRVCDFGGQPTVPTQGGVVRRVPDGNGESIGPVRAAGRVVQRRTRAEGRAVGIRLLNHTRIACSTNRAYVVATYGEGPDSVFIYDRAGEVGRLHLPEAGDAATIRCEREESRTSSGRVIQAEGPCPHWSQNAAPSFDDLGNLVFLGRDVGIYGAIIDPDTGCHAMIRAPRGGSRYAPISIDADSALVLRRSVTEETSGGRTVSVVDANSATGVSIHPIRRVSGMPCPGMLPTVK